MMIENVYRHSLSQNDWLTILCLFKLAPIVVAKLLFEARFITNLLNPSNLK
jgi:hypothetical protein